MKKINFLDQSWLVFIIAGSLFLFCNSLYAGRPQANLDQIRNGPALDRLSPAAWVNGNVNASQAHFVEGYSLAYRVVMTGMPLGATVFMDIEFDTKHGDKHAIDFMTSYNNIEPHQQIWGHPAEVINPLNGYSELNGTSPDFAPIPVPEAQENGNPANAFASLPDNLKKMTIWGARFTDGPNGKIEYLFQDPLNTSTSSTRVRVYFQVTRATVVLSWGGHIASQQNWGFGESASFINGSPYHTRLISWSFGSLGNQDRSMHVGSVAYIPSSIFSGPSDVCGYEFTSYQLFVTSDPNVTILWSLWGNYANATIIGDLTSPTITLYTGGGSTGIYRIQVTVTMIFEGYPITSTSFLNVIVHDPDCTIYSDNNGADELNPLEAAVYKVKSAPPGRAYTYSWSIEGNGSITGPTDQQSVLAVAGPDCYTPFLLTVVVTEAGCQKTCQKLVTVKDMTPPVITCPPDTTVNDSASLDPSVSGYPIATDYCGPITLEYDDIIKKITDTGTIYRHWRATDGNGNQITCIQTIHYRHERIPKSSNPGGNNDTPYSEQWHSENGSYITINLTAYPNPADEKITIKAAFSHDTEGGIEIYNMQGTRIADITKSKFHGGVDYSFTWEPAPALPAGIYLIRVATGSGSKQFRIILLK